MDPFFGWGSIHPNAVPAKVKGITNGAKAVANGARAGASEISQGLRRVPNQIIRLGKRANIAAGLEPPPGRRRSIGVAPRPAYNKRGAKGTVKNTMNYPMNITDEVARELMNAIQADGLHSTNKTRAEVRRLHNKMAKVSNITKVGINAKLQQIQEIANEQDVRMEAALPLQGEITNADIEAEIAAAAAEAQPLPGAVHEGGRRSRNKKSKTRRSTKKHRKTRRH